MIWRGINIPVGGGFSRPAGLRHRGRPSDTNNALASLRTAHSTTRLIGRYVTFHREVDYQTTNNIVFQTHLVSSLITLVHSLSQVKSLYLAKIQ